MADYACDNCGADVSVTVYINKKGRKRVSWRCNNCNSRGFEDYQEDAKSEETAKKD